MTLGIHFVVKKLHRVVPPLPEPGYESNWISGHPKDRILSVCVSVCVCVCVSVCVVCVQLLWTDNIGPNLCTIALVSSF